MNKFFNNLLKCDKSGKLEGERKERNRKKKKKKVAFELLAATVKLSLLYCHISWDKPRFKSSIGIDIGGVDL